MPKWGLTETQQKSLPWDIDEKWLRPKKAVTDPIHHDIYLNYLEAALVDSRPMQRLRGVRQLGTSHLVYPGATHSRFSHALGTLRAAQDLMDAVVAGLSGARSDGDSWLKSWPTVDNGESGVPGISVFDRRVAEATVLARLGGLLHDLCHIPMGHTIEDDLGVLAPHDENPKRFRRLWLDIPSELRAAMGPRLMAELKPFIVSKVPGVDVTTSEYPFVHDIVGNTICADLMDYLRRDHQATGLPISLGNRFVDDFYVTPDSVKLRRRRMAVRITRKGHVRQDAVSEMVKYLRYRYELSERVLYHHTKVAADAMVGKLLDMWHDALWIEHALQGPLKDEETTPSVAGSRRDFQAAVAERGGLRGVNQLDERVADEVEAEFLSWSDDGLLRHLEVVARAEAGRAGPGASRWSAIEKLSRMVLSRSLYAAVGRADSIGDLADAEAIHKEYKTADQRRTVEEGAAKFAGISSGWKVVMWVPSPHMRPKAADVLVDVNGRVAPLKNFRNLNRDALAIVEKHRELWSVGVYVHPEVTSPLRRRAVLAWLRDETGLAFQDERGEEVPRVADLITDVLSEAVQLRAPEHEALCRVVKSTSAMDGSEDFVGRVRQANALRIAEGLGDKRIRTIGDRRLAEQGW